MNLNESKALKDIAKALNEAVTEEPQKNKRPDGVEEWTFADWFGRDLSGETYDGDIDCYNVGITSLKGAPREVSGYFYCPHNQLTSLKGAPKIVNGNFGCSSNKLTSLEGAPEKVGGYFICWYNQLTSLKGAPKEVGGDFKCNDNRLTSLEGAPEKVGGDFWCSDNKLTSLKGAPKIVNGYFDCSNNQLTSLEGAPEKVGGNFYYSHNKLVSNKGKKTNHVLYWRDSDDNSGTNNGEFEFKTKEELENILKDCWKDLFVIMQIDNTGKGDGWENHAKGYADELFDNPGKSTTIGGDGWLGNLINTKEKYDEYMKFFPDEDWEEEFNDYGSLGDSFTAVYAVVDPDEDFDEF